MQTDIIYTIMLYGSMEDIIIEPRWIIMLKTIVELKNILGTLQIMSGYHNL